MASSTLLVADLDSEAPKTAQPSRRPQQSGQGASQHTRHRPRYQRGQHADADEDGHRPHPDQLDGRLAEPGQQGDHSEQTDHAAGGDTSTRGLLVLGLVVGQCGHRRDAYGPPGRADGGDHGHPHPHGQGHDHGPGLEHQRAGGQGDAEPLEELFEPHRGQYAEPEADEGGQQAEYGRLQQHGAEELAPAGPDDAQQGQLPGSLAHDDREGVEDGEATHEQGDEGEDQQRGGEEGECLVDVVGLLGRHRLTGHHLDTGR
jgi:hypothetical protein